MYKKYFNFLIILVIVFAFMACEEDTTGPPAEPQKGSIFIQSTPSGAQIWVNNSNTGKATPDTITNLNAGSNTITLKLSGFNDTSFTITIIANTTIFQSITFPILTQTFGPVRIWETLSPDSSGLDLSDGKAYGISGPNNFKVDIYYSSIDYKIRSADLSNVSGASRKTIFMVGTGTDLNDGVDSPLKDASWVDRIGDRLTEYVFLYDQDQHYSKIKITGFGITPDAYVDITWIYNKAPNDRRF